MNAAARIAQNLAEVRGRIADAARRAGRNGDTVRLVAATKYVSTSVARSLVENGCHDLGESRPQELWAKAAELGERVPPIRWHLIGHLQRNKVHRTLPLVSLVHTVDSLRLLEAIDEVAREFSGQRVEVLIEVNVSADTAKTGISPGEVAPLLAAAAEMPAVAVRGLMGMASLEGGATAAQRDFARLRQLRDTLAVNLPPGVSLKELSMGMSDDFEIAIAEGATIVRVGSALFAGVEP